jgi:signal transduction histidine kinase
MTSPQHRRSSELVLVSFVVIAVLFALTTGGALYETRRGHSQIRGLMREALRNIELAERIGRDMYRRRLLVDAHILEKDRPGMLRVEAQLGEVAADYAEATRTRQALVPFPGEEDAWQALEEDVRALDSPLDETLALSRANQDTDARQALAALDGRFSVIERDVAGLVRINRDGADLAVARVRTLQRWATLVFSGALLLGVTLTLIIGISTSRLVRRREEEVSRYASLLEGRNQELDAFAGRVAHDLRGPLSTISTAASTLSRRAGEEDKTVAILRRGVARMEALIEDLLALSRIDAAARGGVSDPALVAAEVRDDFGERLETEGAALALSVEPVKVRCAEGLLRLALANLVDNALKYRRAEASPRVEIDGRASGQAYELRVSDNGCGMSVDDARQAFYPFFRALRVREQPGTGLGLSIVKRVIEASGGTVGVESELGRGSTFVIRVLPATGGERQSHA